MSNIKPLPNGQGTRCSDAIIEERVGKPTLFVHEMFVSDIKYITNCIVKQTYLAKWCFFANFAAIFLV